MTDIVERLREVQCETEFDAATCDMAADEITRLRAALEQIKALPGEINPSNYDHNDVETLNNAFIEAYHIARAALQQEPQS